jgi:hypothetical protein
MKIFINGNKFLLNTTQRMLAWYPVFIDGVGYGVDNKERLQSVAHSQAEELEIKFDHTVILPDEITILDRVWLLNTAGTYSRKLDPEVDTITILINGTEFKLISIEPMGRYSPIIINGSHYDVDKGERLHAIAHSQAEELKITGVSFEQEITILDRVWSCKPGSSTYRPKQDPALPFPHAGQVVSLDGVEVEVLHLDRGIVFWYNPEDEIHGMVKACKLKSSLVETMRADLAKGLGPKELIALGWGRKV